MNVDVHQIAINNTHIEENDVPVLSSSLLCQLLLEKAFSLMPKLNQLHPC